MIVLVIIVVLFPSAALAQADAPAASESSKDAARQWIPSIALHSGITAQQWDGSVVSTLYPGPGASDPTPMPIRPPVDNDDVDVTPIFGASLELMTPQFDMPLTPRIVAGAEIIPLFGFERAIARQGDPSELRPPVPPGSSIIYDEDTFVGQGSEVTGEMADVAWGAYLGMSFPFEIFDRSLRFKPNLSWIRYEIDFRGLVIDGECSNPNPFNIGLTDCNRAASMVREITLRGRDRRTFHGLGPGFDVELDTTIIDAIDSSIFMGFRAYHILSDTSVEFSVTETFNDGLGTGDVANADFSVDVDDWLYRFVVGFRIQLQGLIY